MIFGTYRTILALAVILHHLGGFWEMGRYAVFGFFILSGFLMNYILHNSYGYSTLGIRKYALNRFLRIFPTFWLFAAFSLILAYFFSIQYNNFHQLHGFPNSTGNFLSNFFLIIFKGTDPRLIPQSWALTVELIWYALIAFGISKTKRITLLWFVSSLIYTAVVNVLKLDWDWKYFSVLSASLPFSTGAILYHYRNEVSKVTNYFGATKFALFFIILSIINYLLFRSEFNLPFLRREIFFYANYAFQGLAIAGLATTAVKSAKINTWDKEIGNLSYPMYLCHYVVAAPIFFIFGEAFSKGSPPIFLASILPILLVSYLTVVFIDKPIERIRRKVKQAKKPELEVEQGGAGNA